MRHSSCAAFIRICIISCTFVLVSGAFERLQNNAAGGYIAVQDDQSIAVRLLQEVVTTPTRLFKSSDVPVEILASSSSSDAPTTKSPTAKPSSSSSTVSPTSRNPTTMKPSSTRQPTTKFPTTRPTSGNPTTARPTLKPSSRQPTKIPTSIPKQTITPTMTPSSRQPTKIITRMPTTVAPTSRKPTSRPTTKIPTPLPTDEYFKLPAPSCVREVVDGASSTMRKCMSRNGLMFNVDAKNFSIAVTSIEIDVMNGTAAEVWTKQGSFVGFETNMSNWTKIKDFNFSSTGLITIPLSRSVTINPGSRQAFYLTMSTNDTYLKYGASYTKDTSISSVIVEDSNLIIHSGTANKYQFGEYLLPRYFGGEITYTIQAPVTASPTTVTPTTRPTTKPTSVPTRLPTVSPTTVTPTSSPTTITPTSSPTLTPTTQAPTTVAPTTETPTTSMTPSINPSEAPSNEPTSKPTSQPTVSPSTTRPTRKPTSVPTRLPTVSPTTVTPTSSPTTAAPTTNRPTKKPTRKPTRRPTRTPTTESPTTVGNPYWNHGSYSTVSTTNNITIKVPPDSEIGDMLFLFLSRTDDYLPMELDGWTTGASCYKTDNEQDNCFSVSDCIWVDGDYCNRFKGEDGYVGHGLDLATVLFYRTVIIDTPISWNMTLRGSQPTWAIITAIPNVNAEMPINQTLGVRGTSCDRKYQSVFPSVYGKEDDILLLSQAFDDTASTTDFLAPEGTTRLGWIRSWDEAGFLYGKELRRTGYTGEHITKGLGLGNGAQCKDALLSIVVNVDTPVTNLFD